MGEMRARVRRCARVVRAALVPDLEEATAALEGDAETRHLIAPIDLAAPFLLELFIAADDDFTEHLLPATAASYVVSTESVLRTLITICKAPPRALSSSPTPLAPLFGFLKISSPTSSKQAASGAADVVDDDRLQIGTLAVATSLQHAGVVENDDDAPIVLAYEGLHRFALIDVLSAENRESGSSGASALSAAQRRLLPREDSGRVWALVECVRDVEGSSPSDETVSALVRELRSFFAMNNKLANEFALNMDVLSYSGEVKQLEKILAKMERKLDENAPAVDRAMVLEELSFFAADQLDVSTQKREALLCSRDTKQRCEFAIASLKDANAAMQRSFEDYRNEQAALEQAARRTQEKKT